jgi:hypothetical protein
MLDEDGRAGRGVERSFPGQFGSARGGGDLDLGSMGAETRGRRRGRGAQLAGLLKGKTTRPSRATKSLIKLWDAVMEKTESR